VRDIWGVDFGADSFPPLNSCIISAGAHWNIKLKQLPRSEQDKARDRK